MAQITIDTLKSFLWSAAENLRGQIDAAGYKEYIFPLLFFKRISDVYDEQYAAFVAEGGEEYAEMQAMELPIRIPDGEHWQDVRQVTENVGQRLVEAFIAIEQANPARENDGRMIGGLEGIFGPKDGWTNKSKMPDYIITSIIEDFSRYNLSLSSCPADEMGQAYEYLVGKFADDAGNTAQEFYTNRTVVELMAEILQPQPDESIYDPTCGSGGMLIKSLDYLRNHGKEWKGVHVFGQEVNGLTSAIARMNLYLNGVEDFSIVCGDTLRNPAFLDGSHLRTFDIVLANPPYSIKEWDRAAFENDKWGRNFLGTPPQGRADYAFIQHILASMDEKNGRCAILLPHGVLFRKEEQEIRKKMIEADLLEAVIGIGPNLFFNATMEACIYICRSNKPIERRNKIMFINAVKEVTRKNGESFLEEQHIQKIVDAYNGYVDVENFCSVVDKEAVVAYEYDLSVQKFAFIPTEQNQVLISTDVAYSAWSEQSVKQNNIMDTFINML
ncbi:MAG: SAM-dependent DNA methyltransferase [Paludibacteraceae bacterium]|nr:SAM-dependent DNA methyltransferase [Paludibacteraceae bacterium]